MKKLLFSLVVLFFATAQASADPWVDQRAADRIFDSVQQGQPVVSATRQGAPSQLAVIESVEIRENTSPLQGEAFAVFVQARPVAERVDGQWKKVRGSESQTFPLDPDQTLVPLSRVQSGQTFTKLAETAQLPHTDADPVLVPSGPMNEAVRASRQIAAERAQAELASASSQNEGDGASSSQSEAEGGEGLPLDLEGGLGADAQAESAPSTGQSEDSGEERSTGQLPAPRLQTPAPRTQAPAPPRLQGPEGNHGGMTGALGAPRSAQQAARRQSR